jgi:cellulose synthase/poly-beta-1,6-N-acetylglucosamine synthase-like glycosyltransferase
MPILVLISFVALLFFLFPIGYLLLLAFASIPHPKPKNFDNWIPTLRFTIAIPAHNEANVITATINKLRQMDYPEELFNICVVADCCSDKTAELARQAGAVVYDRTEGPKTGKGAALSYLFEQILSEDQSDAVIVFDADTQVDPNFLKYMEFHLLQGEQAIQGNHIIRNPDDGWFPALTWAMFMIDNRYQNLGRSNLGWSAKNMGDSICFRARVLSDTGWGEGLTEDYHLRQKLLLKDLKIIYEPHAIGYGEAALNWSQARMQRARWLRGTSDASRQFGKQLLLEGIRRRRPALLDGALQAYLPSYSTLTVATSIIFLFQVFSSWLMGLTFPSALITAWGILLVLNFVYPILGLVLEGAPIKAYLAIFSGPLFIAWRTWIAFTARFRTRKVQWIRTEHGKPNREA